MINSKLLRNVAQGDIFKEQKMRFGLVLGKEKILPYLFGFGPVGITKKNVRPIMSNF